MISCSYDARVANGWDNLAICNEGGAGITNLTFDSGSTTPMCSGSLFERYGRDGLWDTYSLWVTAPPAPARPQRARAGPLCWLSQGTYFEALTRGHVSGLDWTSLCVQVTSTWQKPYAVVIRGMDKTHTGSERQFTEGAGFQSNLASFVTVAGPHSVFLQFWQYECLSTSSGPASQMIEPPGNEYMKALGTPGPTQLRAGVLNGSVMPSADGKRLVPVENPGARVVFDNCDLLITSGAGAFRPYQARLPLMHDALETPCMATRSAVLTCFCREHVLKARLRLRLKRVFG